MKKQRPIVVKRVMLTTAEMVLGAMDRAVKELFATKKRRVRNHAGFHRLKTTRLEFAVFVEVVRA